MSAILHSTHARGRPFLRHILRARLEGAFSFFLCSPPVKINSMKNSKRFQDMNFTAIFLIRGEIMG